MDRDSETLLNARQVRKRLADCSDMTLWRYIRAGVVPDPLVIRRRRFWRASDIDAVIHTKSAA
jgi:predicted DNA-binding transcriptional regulator AlpA